jgi:polygalacturonase
MKEKKFVYPLLAVLIFITVKPTIASAQKNATVFNVIDYGAKSDGKTDNAIAIQKAIDACNKAGGGQVVIPASHTFITGPFNLKSNIDFHVEAGAKILANPDDKVYTKSAFRSNPGEGTIWIGAENIENLTISGDGEINGNGISFMGLRAR